MVYFLTHLKNQDTYVQVSLHNKKFLVNVLHSCHLVNFNPPIFTCCSSWNTITSHLHRTGTNPPPEITITGDGPLNPVMEGTSQTPPTGDGQTGDGDGQTGDGGAASVTAFYSLIMLGLLAVLML